MLLFHSLYIFTKVYESPETAANLTRTIPVKFYMGRTQINWAAGNDVDLAANLLSTIAKTEEALNKRTMKLPAPIHIKFSPIFENEPLPDLILDSCGRSKDELVSNLNIVNLDDSSTPTIIFQNCTSGTYGELFREQGIDVPHIRMEVDVQCSKHVLLFVEKEEGPFLASVVTALLFVAGAKSKNPAYFEQKQEGDMGISYNIVLNKETVDDVAGEECYRRNEL